MTKLEAIRLMEQGKKVTHRYFSANEFATIKNGQIVTEEGYSVPIKEFWAYRNADSWNDGWEEFKPEPIPIPSPISGNQNEQVLQLLITGGFLDPDKLQEARDIIAGCAASGDTGGGHDPESFETFMSNSRDAFVKEINDQEWNQKLRTTAEDLLICFDQMRERIVKGGEDYQAKYADALEWIVILAGPLRELVEIKKLKDATGKTPEYENRQPMAWQSAFQCIELLDNDGGYFKKLPYAELAAKIASSIPSRPSIDIADELRKIAKLSTYDPNHDNMLYNMKDINKLVKELLNQKEAK